MFAAPSLKIGSKLFGCPSRAGPWRSSRRSSSTSSPPAERRSTSIRAWKLTRGRVCARRARSTCSRLWPFSPPTTFSSFSAGSDPRRHGNPGRVQRRAPGGDGLDAGEVRARDGLDSAPPRCGREADVLRPRLLLEAGLSAVAGVLLFVVALTRSPRLSVGLPWFLPWVKPGFGPSSFWARKRLRFLG